MAKGARKGSAFERQICKELSLWWSYGKRDDIYWRSSQSGGRATQRAKSGRKTYGSYGDIAAVDPIGEPLLKIFTIELKRGMSHGDPGDLLDCNSSPDCHKWIQTLDQAWTSHQFAGSDSWMIISQRDRRKVCVFFPARVVLNLAGPLYHARHPLLREPSTFRYRIERFDFFGVTLEKFLGAVSQDALCFYVGDNRKV